MKIGEEISNELMNVSPFLAALDRVNVFQVPEGYFSDLHFRITNYALLNRHSAEKNMEQRSAQSIPAGYFDTLSDAILARIRSEDKAGVTANQADDLSPMLGGARAINVFEVPQGYFDSLSLAVISRIQIAARESSRDELQHIAPLLSEWKGANVFKVPPGYFDTFRLDLLNRIQIPEAEQPAQELEHLSPLLLNLKDKNVFSVPAGYFDNFSRALAGRLSGEPEENAVEELQRLSPALLQLKSQRIFTVPLGYFESLAAVITEKLPAAPAPVIRMRKRAVWLKYAVAAAITGLVTIVSLQFFKWSSNNQPGSAQYASLPDYIKASFQYKTPSDLDAGIAKLDDADIAKFLEKNGNALDNELLINNTDVSEMPSQSDYLQDDNALDSYLDKIEAASNSQSKP